ncbi:Hpt domain-containing protein [Inhella proteolytica]|uniref:Hpt domain-containing protein n=1 Tax=Inhella proteolytica TaxID=2795029 RepID=A0A931NI40_9BURK|nr:Hpt domain-containing protein [Inhella proteolytica]MBH9578448.1 Hpt domain-containing protein [Inhella proteolytica]
MSDTRELIDGETFAELQQTAGAEFVTELVGTFLEEAPRMLAALRTALARDDAQTFRRTAHSIKSNSLSFGAQPLAEAARALELGGLPVEPAALDALDALYQRSAAALQELRHGRRP